MSKITKITIVTVCYNAKNNIRTTIENVMQLKDKNRIEYIVVDGGSIDGTVDIIKDYQDKIDIILSECDSGIYDAMNKGIRLASGDIIGFLNCGDYYDYDAFANVVDIFEEQDVDVVYGNVTRINNSIIMSERLANPVFSDILTEMIVCHQGVFVRTEVQKEHEFCLEFSLAADRKMLIDLYIQGYKFCFVEKNIAFYDNSGVSSINRDVLKKENEEITYRTFSKYPQLYGGKRKKKIENVLLSMFFRNIEENANERERVADFFAMKISIESKIVIWGAGKYGKKAGKLFSDMGYTIDGYLDTSSSVKSIDGYRMLSSEELYNDGNTMIVIASSKYSEEIIDQLKKDNVLSNMPYVVFHHLLLEYEESRALYGGTG